MSKRFWLFRNYVDGVPQFLAFDNPCPCHPGGDPMTLGAPYGVAFFVESDAGREWSDQQVMNEIRTARTADLQARDLKLADLARALPHEDGCRASYCVVCDRRKSDWRHTEKDVPAWHDFTPNTCGCKHGDLLAALEETK